MFVLGSNTDLKDMSTTNSFLEFYEWLQLVKSRLPSMFKLNSHFKDWYESEEYPLVYFLEMGNKHWNAVTSNLKLHRLTEHKYEYGMEYSITSAKKLL